MTKKEMFIICAFMACLATTNAQTIFPAFAKDIATFKKQDSIAFPPKNAILFIGSSSFARWYNLADYFPDHNVINRGFGGSNIVDLVRYAYDVIIPYQPKQVLIYAGDNDLAQDASVEEVVTRFKTLFQIIRTNLPQATVNYVSIKPSPSRERLMSRMKAANRQIGDFLSTQKNAGFIDVFSAMLDGNGNPKPEIFVEDLLHMNAQGYAIWKQVILPYLKK
jgi:lysophospholipase L1-like esterase